VRTSVCFSMNRTPSLTFRAEPGESTMDQIETCTAQRQHIQIRGIVQGVGFRPFVYLLAQTIQLTGYV
jgi:hypothetical protein